jgi:hypothetical protein
MGSGVVLTFKEIECVCQQGKRSSGAVPFTDFLSNKNEHYARAVNHISTGTRCWLPVYVPASTNLFFGRSWEEFVLPKPMNALSCPASEARRVLKRALLPSTHVLLFPIWWSRLANPGLVKLLLPRISAGRCNARVALTAKLPMRHA